MQSMITGSRSIEILRMFERAGISDAAVGELLGPGGLLCDLLAVAKRGSISAVDRDAYRRAINYFSGAEVLDERYFNGGNRLLAHEILPKIDRISGGMISDIFTSNLVEDEDDGSVALVDLQMDSPFELRDARMALRSNKFRDATFLQWVMYIDWLTKVDLDLRGFLPVFTIGTSYQKRFPMMGIKMSTKKRGRLFLSLESQPFPKNAKFLVRREPAISKIA